MSETRDVFYLGLRLPQVRSVVAQATLRDVSGRALWGSMFNSQQPVLAEKMDSMVRTNNLDPTQQLKVRDGVHYLFFALQSQVVMQTALSEAPLTGLPSVSPEAVGQVSLQWHNTSKEGYRERLRRYTETQPIMNAFDHLPDAPPETKAASIDTLNMGVFIYDAVSVEFARRGYDQALLN